jgi:flagellar protein FlaF
MGFSVSGSAAILFVGMFLAFGMFFTASANSFESVSEAQQDRTDLNLEQKNTAITITKANASGGTLTVWVNNTGGTYLALSETSLLLDNDYQSDWRDGAEVDGDGATDLWSPGERLEVTLSPPLAPDRVKVVTKTGVADTEVVD